jgi:sugar phosphate isomerase/epimerase
MDVSLGVAAMPDTPLPEMISFADEQDLDFVELLMEGRGAPTTLEAEREELLDAMPTGLDVVMHLPFGGVDVGSPLSAVRAGARDQLRDAIDLTAAFGGTKAVYHADTFVRPEVWDDAAVWPHVVESVAQLHRYGRDAGVTVCVENVPGPFVSIEEFPALLAATSAPITVDTGHAAVSGLDDDALAAFLADHGDRVGHLHLNDVRGATDEHLPVGMGDTDFAALFDALPADWSGTATVEAMIADEEAVALGVQRLRSLLA